MESIFVFRYLIFQSVQTKLIVNNELSERVYHLMPLEEPAEIIAELKRYSEALDLLTAIGTNLLHWEVRSGTHGGDEGAYVIAFFKRAIDIIDAASLLIEQSSVIPVKGLIRMLMEVELQLEYLLFEPSKISTKVLHLCIMEHYYMLVEAEKILNELGAKAYWPKYSEDKSYLTSIIESSVFDSIRADFEGKIYKKGTKIRRNNPPHWYTLSGAGDTLSSLFGKLPQKRFQREVYSILSETIHSSRLVMATFQPGPDGRMHVKRVRDPGEAKDMVISLSIVAFEIYSWMLTRRDNEQKETYQLAIDSWKAKYPDLANDELSPLHRTI